MKQRWIAGILMLVMLVALIPTPARAASNIVMNGVDIGYYDGSYFTKNGEACGYCHGRNNACVDYNLRKTDSGTYECNCIRYYDTATGGTVDFLSAQCLAFARYCQWKVYGSFATSATSTWVNVTGSVSSGNCTDSNLKSMLNGCSPATHIRVNSGHSISVVSTSDSGITYADCNWNHDCRVHVYYKTWAEFATYIKGRNGIEYAYSRNGVSGSVQDCTCSTSYAGQYVCTTTQANLNIRSGHGSGYGVIGSIPAGEVVAVTKASGASASDWAHVTYNGVSGYASMEYLKPVGEDHADTPTIRWWVSGSEYGEIPPEYKAGNRYWFCYRLYDSVTGKNWDEVENSDYTFTLTFYNPDGSVKFTDPTPNDYDQGWISSFFSEPGTYTAKIVMSGDYTFEGTRTFTVQENPIQVNCSVDSVSLKLGETESQTIYAGYSGYYNGNWSIYYNRSNSNVACTWGAWGDDNSCPLTITANSVGATTVTIYIKDTDTGSILDSTTVAVTVGAKTYTVGYNANGGTGAPAAQTKQHGVDLTLSTTIPERFPYIFIGWESAEGNYEPGELYAENVSATMTAQWIDPEELELYARDEYIELVAPIPYGGSCWYFYFVPEVSAYYRFVGMDDVDNQITLFDADGNQLAFDDDSGEDRQFDLEYYMEADKLYYLKLEKYSSTLTGKILFVALRGFNVNYDANGGEGVPSGDHWSVYDGEYIISETVPVRTGYVFRGWALEADATEPEFYPGEEFDIPADVTLYAVWNPLPYLFYGDLNRDRIVNMTDITILNKYLNGTYTPEYDMGEFLLRCDLNRDGGITSADLEYINAIKLSNLSQDEIENTCEGVSVSRLPKTEYVLGEGYDTDGLTLTFHFGTQEYPITDDLSVSGYNPSALGEQEITVTFYQYSATYTIIVRSTLYGDVNSDGKVNAKDRMDLTRYLAGMSGYTEDLIDLTAADVNCDGKVNTQDRMILTRYLAQWTAYPELPHLS